MIRASGHLQGLPRSTNTKVKSKASKAKNYDPFLHMRRSSDRSERERTVQILNLIKVMNSDWYSFVLDYLMVTHVNTDKRKVISS